MLDARGHLLPERVVGPRSGLLSVMKSPQAESLENVEEKPRGALRIGNGKFAGARSGEKNLLE